MLTTPSQQKKDTFNHFSHHVNSLYHIKFKPACLSLRDNHY